jgi:hypothetical protein
MEDRKRRGRLSVMLVLFRKSAVHRNRSESEKVTQPTIAQGAQACCVLKLWTQKALNPRKQVSLRKMKERGHDHYIHYLFSSSLHKFTAEFYSRDILTRIKHLTLSSSFLEKTKRITEIICVFHSLFTTVVCTHISKIKTIIIYQNVRVP